MLLTNAAQVSNTVLNFLNNSENPALFAGAGVGAQAGLPTWFEFMEHLSTVTRAYEPLSADLIKKRAESGNFLGAATVYKSCREIPQGELLKQMAMPFGSPPHPERLRPLVSLPFTAIFTTNCDRSLHDAVASITGKSPKTVELGDPTMSKAPFFTDFYIGRIHGRMEVPETVVLTSEDYRRLC